jgi:cyanophycin synthetase
MLDIELKRHPLKYPLVIKPIDGTHGNHVLVGIQTRTELELKLKNLFTKTDAAIIEEQLEGNDYRVLVVNDAVVDVVCRDFISIVGDGKTRIDDLIKSRNDTQLKNKDHATHNIDWGLIERESGGLDGDGILAAGKEIMISNVRNYHNGANIKRIDIASIHPDNITMLCKVNKAIGLVVSGVDFMTPDITKSYRENGGTIIEVNANPGLDIHVNPKDTRSSSIGELVVARLFA